jgi:hypothetical protein
MLSYPESREQLNQIFKLINSGRYYSLTFMKVDGTIRYLNGHRAYYKPKDGPEQEVPVAKPTQLEQGNLLVWDRNAVDYKTGEKGAYRKAKLQNIMFIKSGQDILDFMEENDIQKRFNLSDQQIEAAKRQMKIDAIEEEFKVFENTQGRSPMLTISNSPQYFKRMGFDDQGAKIMQRLLLREFNRNGDDGVVDFFKQASGVTVYPIRRGQYIFEPTGGGGEDRLE